MPQNIGAIFLNQKNSAAEHRSHFLVQFFFTECGFSVLRWLTAALALVPTATLICRLGPINYNSTRSVSFPAIQSIPIHSLDLPRKNVALSCWKQCGARIFNCGGRSVPKSHTIQLKGHHASLLMRLSSFLHAFCIVEPSQICFFFRY